MSKRIPSASISNRLPAVFALILCTVLPCQVQGGPGNQQPKLGPRSFFPKEYVGEAYVNMRALKETDLWEELERNLIAGPMMMAFRMEFGFRFRDLDELRCAMLPRKIEGEGYRSVRTDMVTVFQSSRELGLPGKRKQEWDGNRRTGKKVGGFDVVQEGPDQNDPNSWRRPMLFVVPRPKCLVHGHKHLVEPVLTGGRRGGVPHPELMAFTAGKRPLAYIAQKLSHDRELLQNMAPFPFEWYTADDAPRFLMLRLDIDGESQEASAVLTIRFTDGKRGPKLFEDSFKESFKKLDTDPYLKRIQQLKTLAKQLKFETKGTDLLIRCDMGKAAEAMQLVRLGHMVPWFLFSAAGDEVIVEEVEEVAEEEEKPKPRAKKATAPKQAESRKSK